MKGTIRFESEWIFFAVVTVLATRFLASPISAAAEPRHQRGIL
jgi:hypothetical protein